MYVSVVRRFIFDLFFTKDTGVLSVSEGSRCAHKPSAYSGTFHTQQNYFLLLGEPRGKMFKCNLTDIAITRNNLRYF